MSGMPSPSLSGRLIPPKCRLRLLRLVEVELHIVVYYLRTIFGGLVAHRSLYSQSQQSLDVEASNPKLPFSRFSCWIANVKLAPSSKTSFPLVLSRVCGSFRDEFGRLLLLRVLEVSVFRGPSSIRLEGTFISNGQSKAPNFDTYSVPIICAACTDSIPLLMFRN